MVNIAVEIWAHADTQPDLVAVRTPTHQLTFAQLRETTARAAGHFAAAGITPEDRVLFIAPTIMEFPVVYYGLHALGATVITMNTMSTKAEIDYVVTDAEVGAIVAFAQCADAARIISQDKGIHFEVVEPRERYENDEPIDSAYDHRADDTALMLYTSGTTGKPKGAELTAANLVDTPRAFFPVLNLEPGDRFGTALPLFHVYGQCVVMNSNLMRGVSLSILSPFTPGGMIEMIRDHQLTVVAGVPTMWNAMLHAGGDYGPQDFADLRVATSGGASLPVEVINAFKAKFGCSILEGYGLTETMGAATFNDLNKVQKVGTVGPALPGCGVEVRDPASGKPLPADEIGEVHVKGPVVMKGYWNRPEATAADLQDGWFRTGDLGALDEDGYLRIVDRVKDLIIRGGYNVYPREVEEVLYAHPEVVEAAVIGIPDQHYGEEVAAVVVRTPGSSLDEETIRSYAKEQLSAYKVPHVVQFVDELPKGATGKILKRAIDRKELTS